MKVTGPGSGPGALPEDIAGPEKASQAGEKPGVEGSQTGAATGPEGADAGAAVAQTAGSGVPPARRVATHDIPAALRARPPGPGPPVGQLVHPHVPPPAGPRPPARLPQHPPGTLQRFGDLFRFHLRALHPTRSAPAGKVFLRPAMPSHLAGGSPSPVERTRSRIWAPPTYDLVS